MEQDIATSLGRRGSDPIAATASYIADERALAHVDGWKVNIATEAEAVAAVVQAAKRGEPASLFTLNLDHLVKLRTNRAFAGAYARARFVTADGAPVVQLARSQSAIIERTTGADLVLPLAEAAAASNLPVYLFGSSNGVLGAAGQRLSANTDGALSIAGSEAPPMGFDPAGADADAALERIAASGARICFVALGAPKQEIFAARAADLGIPVVFVCIGAALDFIAGAQVRAPGFMQRNGLEWLWRLATNPRRLATRYAQCAVLYAELALMPRRAAATSTND